MPSFSAGPNLRTPFGRNEFLRSTALFQAESYTCAAAAVTVETIDDATDQKVLQTGEILASITSGDDAGKVGPFQAGVADGREATANIVGVCNTFLPWQLMERDVEVAALYVCTAVQAWCFERDAAGARVALSDTTRDAIMARADLNIIFV